VAGIQISIDTSDLRKADLWLATIRGELDFVASRAINATAKSIHANLKRRLPGAVTNPTSWTTRGLLVRYSTRANPIAMVGFNYGDKFGPEGSFGPSSFQSSKSGIPSGRYMDVQARGGLRSAKSSELALRRTYLIRSNQFITPGGYGIGKTNSFGNVTNGNYQQLLSFFRANRDIGVTSNRPQGAGSRGRSAAKRKEVDLFIDRRKGGAIMQRMGKGPKGGTGIGSGRPGRPQATGYKRGIKAAFWMVDAPHYQVRFPVRVIAEAQFKAEVGGHFREALEWALKNPKRS
jgi:hypothetical protein